MIIYKTNECIFCGLKGGDDVLRQMNAGTPQAVGRFRCQDNEACDKRCKSNRLKAGVL